MEETSRRGFLGWYWSCNSERINILSNSIDCNHPSKNTSSLLYSKSCQIENWRGLAWESIHITSTSAKRSLYVTIGQKNWVQKLIDNRKKKLLDSHEKKLLNSHEEKLLDKQNSSKPAQPIPKPIYDRSGQLDSKHQVFVDKSETSRSHEIDEKTFARRTLFFRSIKATWYHAWSWLKLGQICLKKSGLSKLTIDQGNLINMKWDQDAQHRQWVNSCQNWRGHGLQNSRTTTFHCEAIAGCPRSRIDSENREPPEPTCSSTRPTTESIV